MSFCFIFTTSSFINWSSNLDSNITNSAKKLFTNLRIMSEIDKIGEVVAVEETDKNIRDSLDNDSGYNFVKAHYEKESNTSGGETEEIIKLAVKKSKLFDKVIIINGYVDLFLEDPRIVAEENIEVKNEVNALSFLIKNCNI